MSKTTSETTTRKGYSEKDVRMFLQQGATQSVGNTGVKKPKMKEHHTTTDFYGTKMPWEKSKTNTSTPKETGFMGAFSMASKADIDSLTEAFLSRQRQIQQRTLAPGRSAFLSER